MKNPPALTGGSDLWETDGLVFWISEAFQGRLDSVWLFIRSDNTKMRSIATASNYLPCSFALVTDNFNLI